MEGNKEVKDVISILNNITVPDHPDCPSAMFRFTKPSQVPQADVQAGNPSNVSTAGCAEDPSMTLNSFLGALEYDYTKELS